MVKTYRISVLVILDTLETIGLLICSLLAGPFLFFRSCGGLSPFIWQFKILLPRAMFAASLRASLDEKLGNYEQAAATFNYLIQTIEKNEAPYRAKDPGGRLITYLYNRLARIYLMNGRIDDATCVIIRAHRFLGVESLSFVPELDVRSARIIKAGIAAGKLLDEGGLATLTVRTGLRKKDSEPEPKDSKMKRSKIVTSNPHLSEPRDADRTAKILPFQRPTET